MKDILGIWEVARLKFDRIKASTRTTHLFGMLKANTNVGPEPWARLALCLSLREEGIPNPDEHNRGGSEFDPARLFGSDENMYLALMVNRLKRDGLDPKTDLVEMTRAHLNRGATSLKQRVDDLSDLYKFIEKKKDGSLGLDR